MTDLTRAIRSLYPNAEWNLKGSTYDGLEWLSQDIPKPSLEELENEIRRISYKHQRAVEYPPLVDQLDMLYHDKIDGTNTWQESIQAVKDKYPKPQ